MSLSQEIADLATRLKASADHQMDDTLDRVTRAWGAAWEEITDEWQAALQALVEDVEDGRWPTRASIIRSEQTTTALGHTLERLQQLTATTGREVAGALPGLLDLAAAHQSRLIAAQLPAVHARLPVMVATRSLDAIVARATQQITAASHPIPTDVGAHIRSALIRGTAIGENPREAAADMLDRIGSTFDLGRRRAETIARTEMVDANREAARLLREANADVVAGWAWCATLGPRTCQVCVAMHGTVYPHDAPGPLDHPSGRCTSIPVTKTWRELGIDIDEPHAPAMQPGPDWFDHQPEATQRSILGARRYEAWRRGDYPPDQWAVRKQNPGWRDSHVPGPVGGIKAEQPTPRLRST